MTETAPDRADGTEPSIDHPHHVRRGIGLGLVTAVAGLGAAELVSGVDRRFASPITQVGNRVIDAAPPWLKTFAIETFGTKDKPILVGSVMVLLLVFAAGLGILSRRHLAIATAGAALFGVVGVAAAVAGVGGIAAAVPSAIGGVVAVVTIRFLAARAWTTDVETSADEPASTSDAATAATPEDTAHESPIVHKGTGDPAPVLTTNRRAFLTTASTIALVGAGAAASGRWLRGRFDAAVDRAKVMLPKAKEPLPALDVEKFSAGVDGVTPFITPDKDFYRVDTALELPQVAIDTWTLEIGGMVDKPLSFTFDQLLERDLVEADVTLTCVSNEVGGNLAGTGRWLGVPLRELLDEAGVRRGADQIVGRSVDGYTCGFPTEVVDGDRTALLVVGMNGEPLSIERGYPARLLVAGLYGYVSATKWLKEIELTSFADFDQYWVPRGWDAKAPIKTFSRIDTPKGLGRVEAGRRPIAGVAWAQTRGISAVEVKVDDGEWIQAELRPVPNDETWCQWVLPYDFTSGSHKVTCRATDGNGDVQTEERAAPRPNGASGWHSVVTLVA